MPLRPASPCVALRTRTPSGMALRCEVCLLQLPGILSSKTAALPAAPSAVTGFTLCSKPYTVLAQAGGCRGPLPSVMDTPRLEYFTLLNTSMQHVTPNSRGELLPEYLTFGK